MRTSVSLTRSLLVILCLSFLPSGCQSSLKQEGHQSGLGYRTREVPAYELVIMLHPLSEQGRVNFLLGFSNAYDEAHDGQLGQEYVNVLSQSLVGGFYERGIEQGRKYVNGHATDTGIQELISISVGLSQGSSLDWRAGDIVGFAEEMARQKPEFAKEHYYGQAETKYNALRGALGV